MDVDATRVDGCVDCSKVDCWGILLPPDILGVASSIATKTSSSTPSYPSISEYSPLLPTPPH